MSREIESSLTLRNEIYQSNPLIQARKNFDMVSTRIFLMGLQGINPHLSEKDKYYDVKFKELFIPTNKLTELFGNTKYLAELKPTCQKLFNTVIELSCSDGGSKLMHLFDKLDYEPQKGLHLQFSWKMRPYLLDLFQSRGYTKINVEYLFTLSSPYAVRVLELLLQYQNIELFKLLKEIKRKLTVDELRFALNVPEGAYRDRIDNFRARVLDVAIREINTRTPYLVQYKTVKEGRRVVAFEFTMSTFMVPTKDTDWYDPKFNNNAMERLMEIGFTEKASLAIFKKCKDVQDCLFRISRAQALLERQRTHVRNKLGFLRKAIVENWQMGDRPPKSEQEAPKVQDWSNKPQQLMPQVFTIGGHNLPYSIAKKYYDLIQKGERLEGIAKHLKYCNTTIARFVELWEKQESKAKQKTTPRPNEEINTPPRQRLKMLKLGKKGIPYSLAKNYAEAIKNGENLEKVAGYLQYFKLTIEEFKELWKKNESTVEQEEARAREEAAKTPEANPLVFTIGEHTIAYSIAKKYYDLIQKGERLEGIAKYLEYCNTTIEEFVKLWKKQAPTAEQEESRVPEETTKTPEETPQVFKIGEHTLPYSLAKRYFNLIQRGEVLEGVAKQLEYCNTTIEEFVKLWKKQAPIAEKEESRVPEETTKALEPTPRPLDWATNIGLPESEVFRIGKYTMLYSTAKTFHEALQFEAMRGKIAEDLKRGYDITVEEFEALWKKRKAKRKQEEEPSVAEETTKALEPTPLAREETTKAPESMPLAHEQTTKVPEAEQERARVPEEAAKTPEANPLVFTIGEHTIAYSIAKKYYDLIQKGERLEGIAKYLEYCNTTIEEFVELWKKQESTAEQEKARPREEITKAPESTAVVHEETTKAPEPTPPVREETTKAPEPTPPVSEETTKALEPMPLAREETNKAPGAEQEGSRVPEEAAKTPEANPLVFRIGGHNLPRSIAKKYYDLIQKGERLEGIAKHLAYCNSTIEEFVELWKKQPPIVEQKPAPRPLDWATNIGLPESEVFRIGKYTMLYSTAKTFHEALQFEAMRGKIAEDLKRGYDITVEEFEDLWITRERQRDKESLIKNWAYKCLKPRPKEFKIGEKAMPYATALNYASDIRKGENLDTIIESLKEYNVTIDEFALLWKKHEEEL